MANARIGKRAVAHLKKLLRNTSTEVLGHIESTAICCRGGTVAIVKVDLTQPAAKSTAKKTR